MKLFNFIIFSLLIISQTACEANYKTDKTSKIFVKDTVKRFAADFLQIKISDDSLDLALFNLILNSDKYSDNELIKNIEFLISEGADPNVSIEYQYSVRKFGTYIPIIKHFYNNKYRRYKTTSTAFLEAVNTGKYNLVKKFIELNADVNQASKAGVYPINLAISDNYSDIIDLLLKNDCDISLADLSLSKNVDLIEKLVKLGADNETININFALNSSDDLKRLINLHPDINKYPLNYKIIFNTDTLLAYLLKNGLNNSARGDFPDRCPLIYGAVKYGNLQTVQTLKNAGINILDNCKGIDDEILFTVIKSQKTDILNYYLNTLKVNPDTKDWTGKSALIIAAETDNDEIIKMLLSAGANIEYTGYFDKTPLMHAVQYNKYVSAEILIKEGANVNYKKQYGETPLIIAIQEKDYAMIKLLVENGADTKIKYNDLSLSEYAKSENAPNMITEYLKNNE